MTLSEELEQMRLTLRRMARQLLDSEEEGGAQAVLALSIHVFEVMGELAERGCDEDPLEPPPTPAEK